jgi:hypothetical protein
MATKRGATSNRVLKEDRNWFDLYGIKALSRMSSRRGHYPKDAPAGAQGIALIMSQGAGKIQ